MGIRKLIEKIENAKISLPLFLVTFFAVVISRSFLEGIFEISHTIGVSFDIKMSVYNFFCHYFIFWAFMVVLLLILLKIITKDSLGKLSNIIIICLLLIDIVPLLDSIFYGGTSLIYLKTLRVLQESSLLLFAFPVKIYAPYGPRIEVFLAVVIAFIYVFVKTGSKIKSILAMAGVYVIALIIAAAPMVPFLPLYFFRPSYRVDRLISDFFESPPNLFHFSATRYAIIVFFMLVICLLILFFLFDRKKFVFFVKTIRYSRHIYYTVIYICGFLLAFRMLKNKNDFFSNSFDYAYLLAGTMLVNFLFLTCQMMNNLYDKKIDFYNQKLNPLNAGKSVSKSGGQVKIILSTGEYLDIFWIVFLLTLFLAFSISLSVFILSLFICVIGFLYSCPPYRFKNIFILNTFIIALSSLLGIFLGFTTYAQEISPRLFPVNLSAVILLVLTLAFNVKDINDYVGDKNGGVKTFMTVFGEKWGIITISGLAFTAYMLVPVLLFSRALFLPALGCGIATILLITLPKGKINEPLVFLVFFIFLGLFIYLNPFHL